MRLSARSGASRQHFVETLPFRAAGDWRGGLRFHPENMIPPIPALRYRIAFMPTRRPVRPYQKRIYTAVGTSLVMSIKGPSNEPIGTLTIEPNALNAIIWRGHRKREVSDKKKTLLNLIEWLEG